MLIQIIISCLILSFLVNFALQFISKKLCANICLLGRTAVITGGNSGNVKEIALNLASRGCRVIIGGPIDADSDAQKYAIIRETNNANIVTKILDLGSLSSVRQFARDIIETERRLDILINNAVTTRIDPVLNMDGLLNVTCVNYFGPFLLTYLLIEKLRKTQKSRIVFVTSTLAFFHKLSSVNDINQFPRTSNAFLRSFYEYANSKVCILAAASVFAQKLNGNDITCNSVYLSFARTLDYFPECFIKQSVIYKILYLLLKVALYIWGESVQNQVQPILYCALSSELNGITGKCFCNGIRYGKPKLLEDLEFCEGLWQESQKLVGITYKEKMLIDL